MKRSPASYTSPSNRWLSITFTLFVVANLALMGQEVAQLVGFPTLVPLLLLLATGLYLFVLPYAARRATAFPAGRTGAGPPIGLQVVAAHGGDLPAIDLVRRLAAELGGFVSPPGLA